MPLARPLFQASAPRLLTHAALLLTLNTDRPPRLSGALAGTARLSFLRERGSRRAAHGGQEEREERGAKQTDDKKSVSHTVSQHSLLPSFL